MRTKIKDVKRKQPHECAVLGCRRRTRSKGFCPSHYQKYRMLKRTDRLPITWDQVARGGILPPGASVVDVVLKRGRSKPTPLADALKDLPPGAYDLKRKPYTNELAVMPRPILDALAETLAGNHQAIGPKGFAARRFVLRKDHIVIAEGVQFSDGQMVLSQTGIPGLNFHWVDEK